jgi:hypothetical protein
VGCLIYVELILGECQDQRKQAHFFSESEIIFILIYCKLIESGDLYNYSKPCLSADPNLVG